MCIRDSDEAARLPDLLRAFAADDGVDGQVVAIVAARQALAERDLNRLTTALRTALTLAPAVNGELAELIVAVVRLAEETAQPLAGIEPHFIEAGLDLRTGRGDRDAAYALGRALCGIDCGVLQPATLADGLNMRKGVALLLRAADAGCDEAWLHLYLSLIHI